MFCSACGNNVAAGEKFCRVCGKEVPASAATAPVVKNSALAAPPETSGKAIVSLICGLFLFVFPMSILAIIFGHLSLSEIRKSAGRLKGDGIAMAGLVLGYVGVAAIPVILIIAAIAIPNLLRARMAANEASAVASVRTLLIAEVGYAGSHGDAGYTCTLSELADAGLNNAELLSGQKNGYVFRLQKCASNAGNGPNMKYQVLAYPVKHNQTGTRVFCSDESTVIKADSNADAEDCPLGGSPLE